MPTYRPTLAAGAALIATLTACGVVGGDDNGFADESAADILNAARKASGKVDAVHVSGRVTDDGKKIDFDLHLNDRGDCRGTMTVGSGGFELLKSGKRVFIKADKAFFESTGASPEPKIRFRRQRTVFAFGRSSGLPGSSTSHTARQAAREE